MTDESQIYTTLRQYKWDSSPRLARQQSIRLAGLVATFLNRHRRCISRDGWDLVTVVPSTRDRQGSHPLAAVLGMIEEIKNELVEVLRPGPGASSVHRNTGALDGFTCSTDVVAGKRILLVDDTLTTGAHLQSAGATLRTAGARNVTSLVIGRRLNASWPTTQPLVDWASRPENRWSPNRCILCWEQ